MNKEMKAQRHRVGLKSKQMCVRIHGKAGGGGAGNEARKVN